MQIIKGLINQRVSNNHDLLMQLTVVFDLISRTNYPTCLDERLRSYKYYTFSSMYSKLECDF